MNPRSSAQPLDTTGRDNSLSARSFRVLRWINIADWSVSVPLAILAGLLLAYLLMQPSAISMSTLTSNLNDALPLIMVSAGQALVIIGGGIDLSVGGVVSLINVLAATHLSGGGWELVAGTIVLILLGLGIGACNGLLIAVAGLSPVIVTIATWSIGGGVALFILSSPGGNVPDAVQNFWTGTSAGWPNALIVLIILEIIWSAFRRTRSGVGLYASGSDAEAARLTGVAVWRSRFLAYTLSGGLSALAGIFLAASTATGDPTVGSPFILNSIAAVVIGGTAISGGRGGLTRTIVGACIFTIIGDVLFAANISAFLTPLVTGLFLILVVAISTLAPAALTAFRGRQQ